MNEIFTDETIVKVYSGNDSVLLALQRDFGIYTVNLVSLAQAARVLSYGNDSVKDLLKRFCDIKYSLLSSSCDWRYRPLSQIMIDDCRKETHFMGFLFDMIRKRLIESSPQSLNLVQIVLFFVIPRFMMFLLEGMNHHY